MTHVPLVSHPLSQFGSGTQWERYQILSTLPIYPNYAFNLSELNKVGLGDSVLHILRTSKWELFVQIDEPSYTELLLKFLATFSFEKRSVTFDKPNTIKFRLENQRFSLSLTKLSIHCGFYTPDFTSNPDYQNFHFNLDNEILALFWNDLCFPDAPSYDPRMTKGSALRDPII